MAKLYEIVDDLRAFLDTAEGLEDEQAYKDTLEALTGELDDKVEQWCKAIKNLEGERDATKAEADRLAARTKSIDNNIDRMKDTLKMYLDAAGLKKAGGVIGAKIVKNGGKAPLIIDVEPIALPFDFQKVTISANNEAIRDALEHGKEIPGAHIGERGEHIKIG